MRSVTQHLVALVLIEAPPIAHLRHLGGCPSLADSVTKRVQASIHTLPRKVSLKSRSGGHIVAAHLRCPVWRGRDAAVEVPCLEVEAGVVPGAAVAQLVAGGGQVPAHVAALWETLLWRSLC